MSGTWDLARLNNLPKVRERASGQVSLSEPNNTLLPSGSIASIEMWDFKDRLVWAVDFIIFITFIIVIHSIMIKTIYRIVTQWPIYPQTPSHWDVPVDTARQDDIFQWKHF